MGAHVLRYIEDVRGHRKSPKTAKWVNVTIKNHSAFSTLKISIIYPLPASKKR